jgi:3-oxoacyl-[acyl-carrier protein] reductase
MILNLENKVALVTGATGDIGFKIAETLSKASATVILSGRSEEKLLEVQSKIPNSIIKVCDMKNTKECAQMVADLDKIDILVCNAGMTKDNLFLKMKQEDFEEVISVNLSSTFALNKAALTKMIRQKSGRVINISSIVGVMGNPGQSNYAASKAGIIGLTKSLAKEVAERGVTVNTIAPGFITTQMTDVLTLEQKDHYIKSIPMKKFGTVDDIANAVLFLSSDLASYITGQTLHVNGGLLTI